MALVPAVLTLNVSPCSFSVAVDSHCSAERASTSFETSYRVSAADVSYVYE